MEYSTKIDVDDNIVEISELLKGWVSGEELARKLNVSRTAVWKKIKRLRNMGYVIEGAKGKGYRIVSEPKFSPISVVRSVRGSLIKTVYYYDVLDSTNNKARELPENSLVIAEEQIMGKGRLGRKWFSKKGGLYFSIALKPEMNLEDIPKLTLTSGVAVARALEEYQARLKWPNDVLINGKKVCGILSEIVGEIENFKVIVGIGINVENAVPDYATNLKNLNSEVNRAEILKDVIEQFTKYYKMLLSREWNKIRFEWLELSDTIGKFVEVKAGNRTYRGKAIDMDYDGGLIVETEEGTEKVFSGDCFYI
ncbi:birA, biotin-(acetyl-CoA-carboxylase) ligase region [Archaeoglobus sulfaticallidus PM70-1]|uniref:BirA, biotin-(Acetyl-CoA-carboxylase) ligase region n=1 Tax=Archaeoglobus sulfaticallidus PM70-1 TaxID=387631 RepID=N0BNA4_9EURY|nr:biotin--[acetyl-CoA-carboxylase] ligase [Archaeoglobus sulfaticallidus]AGK62111.1 birA, biotin-(acetyl-CoA-carboxylase) ligase region [Archaeoglobus sulfaticallidus PM70-1]